MAYWDWTSDPEAQGRHVVICVHGLSRQGRDFDVLAQALTPRSRVLAVDVPSGVDGDGVHGCLHSPAPRDTRVLRCISHSR